MLGQKSVNFFSWVKIVILKLSDLYMYSARKHYHQTFQKCQICERLYCPSRTKCRRSSALGQQCRGGIQNSVRNDTWNFSCPVTSSSNVSTNIEYTNLRFFFTKISLLVDRTCMLRSKQKKNASITDYLTQKTHLEAQKTTMVFCYQKLF